MISFRHYACSPSVYRVMMSHCLHQMVRALDVLYELLKSSPRLEQVQTIVLDWGVEQFYGLLLNPNFGDEVRERVFRVRTNARC